MRLITRFSLVCLILTNPSFAKKIVPISVSKPVYCDTSGGRMVLNNGSYSQLYCRRSAVMNFQSLSGCCTWNGGVMLVKQGNVICNDSSVSPVCSLQNEKSNFELRSDDSVNLNE